MIKRRKTRFIKAGNVLIGGDAPISVQSMTTVKTENIDKTVAQILKLEEAGCEIIRVAVPNLAAARAIYSIKKEISIPLIADIHFDYKLAAYSVEAGADGFRYNPGNISNKEKIFFLASCAKYNGSVVRIGINAGSLEKKILKKYSNFISLGMVKSALMNIRIFRKFNFNNIKISLKSSRIDTTIEAYRILSNKVNLPFHVGITEAGTKYGGIVKSAIGIGSLLSEGIGDTIRVSLTDNPLEEVYAGFEILKTLSLRYKGPKVISCPSCGRCEIDLFNLVKCVKKYLLNMRCSITVAIMGCVVNGPGEAKEADIGIAGGNKIGVIFKKGRVIKKISEKFLLKTFLLEMNKFIY